MGLSAFYGQAEPDEVRFKVLDRALELGETFWDSADAYLDSEDLVGKWFKRTGKRDQIFLATKFGNKTLPNGKGRVVDSSPEFVKEACEKSLKRLGIETIDLYYCHRVDKKTPIEKTVEAMVELKKYIRAKFLSRKDETNKQQGRQDQVPRSFRSLLSYSSSGMQGSPHRRRPNRVLAIRHRY